MSLRDALGERDFESAWAEDAALSTDEAIAYARRGAAAANANDRPAVGHRSPPPSATSSAAIVEEPEAVHLVDDGRRPGHRLDDASGQLEADVHHLCADVEQQVAGRGRRTVPRPLAPGWQVCTRRRASKHHRSAVHRVLNEPAGSRRFCSHREQLRCHPAAHIFMFRESAV